MRKTINIWAGATLLTLAFAAVSCQDDPIPLYPNEGSTPVNYTYGPTADSMQVATFNTYLGSNNTFVENNAGSNTFHYWPNAHALDVLVDGYLRTDDPSYVAKMKALHDGIKIKNGGTFNNVFNDDMIWLGNACMRAYQATGDADYKATAQYLWTIIKQSWSNVMGGGITWKQDTPNQKNAVSNAPAAILAMRLYEADGNADDLQWAKDIYAWQKGKLVDASTGVVWDNVSLQNGEEVVNSSWVFTYNMGTWIGAGLRLYHATDDVTYLNDALKTAKASAQNPLLVSNGLMKDEGQGDGGLFKGILVRYFTEMIQEPNINDSDRSMLANFLEYNAQTFYKKGLKRPAMTSGSKWDTAPSGTTDLTTQLSGMMLMEAAALLQEDGIFD